MACCEVLFGTVRPTTPPSEAQIPIYIDRTSKKVYYWNGTGWELIWEIQTAGVGTPGVVSIDPNSPIYVGEGGTLQINCERLKTQCGFATVQEVSEAVSSAINELVKSLNTSLQGLDSRVTTLNSTVAQVESRTTNLNNTVTQLESGLTQLAGRVSSIEAWDLCAKTSSCGYSTGVTKLIAGANITLTPSSGVGDVTIAAAGGGGGGGTAGVTKVTSASPEIKVTPASGVGDLVLQFLGCQLTGNGQNGFFDIGNIRVQWGTFITTTGNLDTVTMQYPFGATPYTIIAMERKADGWGAYAPQPTIYGTQNHPTDPANKFLVSCVRVLNDEQAALVGERTKFERAGGQWFGIGLKP